MHNRPRSPLDVEAPRSVDFDGPPPTRPQISRNYRPTVPPPQPPPRLPKPALRLPQYLIEDDTRSQPPIVEDRIIHPSVHGGERSISAYNFSRFADASEHVEIRNGIPELDLHKLRVWEAKKVTQMFVKQSRGRYRRVKIITGRGLHSAGGIPKIKPEVEVLLQEAGLSYEEVNKGGCFEVML